MANGCNFIGPQSRAGESCCDAHDKAYRKGGSKLAADVALFNCIRETRGGIVLACFVFVGVTVGGWPAWIRYRF